MRNLDRAAKFDDWSETSGFGEVLPVDRRHCLLLTRLSGCKCGACGGVVDISVRPTRCQNESCDQEWSCIVVTPGTPEVVDPWLTIYSESALTGSLLSPEHRSKAYRARMGMAALESDDPTLL